MIHQRKIYSFRTAWILPGLFVTSLLVPGFVAAEPYLAVRSGLKCSACHTNPTGGGKRNNTGRVFGQTSLPRQTASTPIEYQLHDKLDLGANFRFSLSGFDRPEGEDTLAFDTVRSNIYLESILIEDRLTLYLDQQFAPSSINREMWALLSDQSNRYYAKVGKFFPQFGWRLEDDSSFVRSTSGFNFLAPDNGIELGMELQNWSVQVALTNGSAGGIEVNQGKQLVTSAVYVRPQWRLGSSLAYNDDDIENQTMYALYAGAILAGTEVLFELDRIRESASEIGEGNHERLASLVELNRQVAPGSNIKLTYEYLDPDRDVSEDQHDRISLVWEMTPLPMLQLRLGTRQSEGIPQNVSQNTDFYFLQLHTWY